MVVHLDNLKNRVSRKKKMDEVMGRTRDLAGDHVTRSRDTNGDQEESRI